MPSDRLAALAWQQVKAGECGGCGGDLAETTNPDNEDAYTFELARCFRCAARERTTTEFTKQEGASAAGLMSYLAGGPSVTVA